MTGQSVLIAGGYGVVGQRIAAHLACDYRVLVAGRHQAQANAVAAAIGHHAVGREIDVTTVRSIAAALDGVTAVVSCIDQPERLLLKAAIERGLAYTDITPHLVELGRGEAYDALCIAAKRSGARVVLGTGIVPGISNVIVRALANNLDGAEKIATSLLLSADDTSGPASLDYFAKELTMPFQLHIDGQDIAAHAFTDPTLTEFPPPFGPRWAYLFPFSDQVLYPRTMGAKTVLTRLSLEPPRLGRLLAVVLRIGAARLLELDRVRRTLVAHRGKSEARRATGSRTLVSNRRRNSSVVLKCSARNYCAAHTRDAGETAADATCRSNCRSLTCGDFWRFRCGFPTDVCDPPLADSTALTATLSAVEGSLSFRLRSSSRPNRNGKFPLHMPIRSSLEANAPH